jgi:hypothetical protein
MSVRVDGLAFTPVGSPLRETLTWSVNPFNGVAVTDTVWPAAATVKAMLVGATVSEKSGAGAAAATVSAIVAVWLKPSEVPLSVIADMPAAAFAAAVSVILCAVPGVRVSVDGLAATPEGNPLRDTFTLPTNPFRAFAVTDTPCPAVPAVRARLVGATISVKSGAGAAADTVSTTVAV